MRRLVVRHVSMLLVIARWLSRKRPSRLLAPSGGTRAASDAIQGETRFPLRFLEIDLQCQFTNRRSLEQGK